MTKNMSATPYIIQINEPIETIHLTEEVSRIGIQIDPDAQELTAFNGINNPQILVKSSNSPVEIVQETTKSGTQNFGVVRQEQPCIVQIVYPQELSLTVRQC
jgi:hypothetical protein